MEGLRKSLSKLNLSEPNAELSVQRLSKSSPLIKNAWLRYRPKYLSLLNNIDLFHRHLNRFFKWNNRFVVLTEDDLHIFKTEFQTKTQRSINMADVKTVTLCSETYNYEWCIKLVPSNPEDLPILLAAPLQTTQEEWYFKIKDCLDKCKNRKSEQENGLNSEINAENIYDEVGISENIYHQVDMSDNDFLEKTVTYHESREELLDVFETCASLGNYVIRKSRKSDSAVLSVYDTKGVSEFLIFRENQKLSINKKITFDNTHDLLDYYKECTLPNTDLKLTKPFCTFKKSNFLSHKKEI